MFSFYNLVGKKSLKIFIKTIREKYAIRPENNKMAFVPVRDVMRRFSQFVQILRPSTTQTMVIYFELNYVGPLLLNHCSRSLSGTCMIELSTDCFEHLT